MIGASLLWVGWFGFNAGSNLEANGGTALAMINTFVATAGAALGWLAIEWMRKGQRRRCSARSRARSPGLVAVTPAAGFAGPMGAIVLGVDRGRRLLLLLHDGEGRVRLRRQPRRLRHPRRRRHRRRDRHRRPGLSPALGGVGFDGLRDGPAQVSAQFMAVGDHHRLVRRGLVRALQARRHAGRAAGRARRPNARASIWPSTASAPTRCEPAGAGGAPPAPSPAGMPAL